jgi:dethiobiotin synthetase
LTLEAARARGLQVAGVILNGRRDQHEASLERNADLITSLGGMRVIGQTPWVEGSLTTERLSKLAPENILLDPLLSVLKDASRA